MRAITTIIIIFAIVSCKSVHSTINPASKSFGIDPTRMENDTLRYLQKDIVENKQKFIGKTLENLLQNLKFEVRTCIPGRNYPQMDSIESIGLIFHSVEEYNNIKNNVNDVRCLNIEFQKELPIETSVILYKKNYNSWTKEEREYYGKQIVKDVVVPGMLLK